jgi:hypothetical protein
VHDADEPTDDPEVGVTRLPVPIPGAPVETGKPRLTGASGERTTGLEPRPRLGNGSRTGWNGLFE